MLAALWAVLIDLWHFAIGRKVTELEPTNNTQSNISVFSGNVKEPVVAVTKTNEPKKRQFDTTLFPVGSLAYVLVEKARCFKRPVLSYDEAVAILKYGDVVSISHIEGLYARVETGSFSGWMRTDTLTDAKQAVYATLTPGQQYSSEHEATVAVRRWLDDEMLGGVLKLPLQPEEYVLYELLTHGKEIDWPLIRPRTAGQWHKILKGARGIKIGIEPKTGAVIEYMDSDSKGVLGYVESVTPELTIKVKSLGLSEEGECREDTLPAKEWRELRPVFISV